MNKVKQVLKNFHEIIKKNYSLIFIAIMFFACIIKTVYSVGMFDNPYHFEFSFSYGLSVMGPRIIILIMTYIVLFSFGFVFKNIFRYIYLIVIYVATTIFCYMDLKYARFFQGPPSIFWTIMPHNSNNDVSMSYFVHYAVTDFLYYSDMVLVVFMFFFGIFKKRFTYSNTRFKLRLSTCMGSFVLLTIVSLAIPNETYLAQNTTKKVSSYGNFMYHMIDILQLHDYDKNIKMTSSDKKLYYDYEELLKEDENNSDDPYASDVSGSLKDSNLIVLQLEAVESFVLGNSINGQEITPFLNSLLNTSVQMNVYEQVRTGNSSDCDLMFMGNQYPVSKVISFNQFPDSEYLSIADVLKKNGYKTMYFNSSYGSTWNYEGVMETTMGFDEMHYGDEIPESSVDRYSLHKFNGYISDEVSLDYVYDLIKGTSPYKKGGEYTTSDKFYVHSVLCSSHLPYVVPKVLDENFLNDSSVKKDIGSEMYKYLTLVHYIDESIKLFVEKLKADGLMDNTTLLIMGDHGGIHKYMSQHTSKKTECKDKYQWMTKASNYTVLNVIYNKNLDHHYVIGDNCNTYNFNNIEYRPDLKYHVDKKCAQIDVTPTLAYMYGINDQFKVDGVSTFMGRNMFKTSLSYAIMANESVKGTIPSKFKKLNKAQYLSNVIIKSEYFNNFDYVK
ncbi:MAG: sulfatase-like hydrolase/transferase [Acholeplasmatales bacterium]|nr:sulfatase-like hydrolase/transferase [Acholeplasmatales bacterium]